MSRATVGWLILAAAVLTLVAGILSRILIGRHRHTEVVRATIRTLRRSALARVLFGRFDGEVLDDDELDSMILMPTLVIACGLCLTALFLVGYDNLV